MSLRVPVTVLTAAMVSAGASVATFVPSARADGPNGGDYQVTVLASGNSTMFGPDDITMLDNDLFVGFQNGVSPTGGGGLDGNSTIAEYARTGGDPIQTWSVTGKCDGLTADPANNRVIGTLNEDGNTSLFTIDPPSTTVTTYSYSGVPHGGGTDAISIYDGQILISASAPDTTPTAAYPDVPAVYVAQLSGSTASLTPLFNDNAQAALSNMGPNEGQSTTLALSDPDSNGVVPTSAPRFGGAFVLDGQGDQQQIYMGGDGNGSPTGLSVLNLSQAIDDTAWATSSDGTLYATDSADNEIVAITGHLRQDGPYVVATPADSNNAPANPGPNYLGVLDMRTGKVIAVPGVTIQPKSMIFAR